MKKTSILSSTEAKSIVAMVLILLVCGSINTKAQNLKSFRVNDKDLNVKKFDKEIDMLMEQVGIPGMLLAVIDNNKVVYANGYGTRRGTKKVNKNTFFSGGSLSKSFLAFVVYQLADEGKLDLDKPMHLYLEHELLKHDDRYKLITPRMVLSHSSGIENWFYENEPDALEIVSDPGKKFIYSGEGYQYLAKVVEVLLGKSYEDYINERVITPLILENTYLKFKHTSSNPFRKISPSNYSLGHNFFGRELEYFFNPFTTPAAGNHFSARDYAKLIVSIFDTTYVTSNRLKDVLKPVVRVHDAVFYASGFEIVQTKNDTIIAHGGDNLGHKNYCFYSPGNKTGFVFMTNSDRGFLVASKLSEMTVDLDLSPFFTSYYLAEQYPSGTLELMKVYDQEGHEAMVAKLNKLISEKKISISTLNVLGGFFSDNEELSTTLFHESIKLNPKSPLAYGLLGRLYFNNDVYDSALKYLEKAKALHFTQWDLEDVLEKCKKELVEIESRKSLLIKITDNQQTVAEAEHYNQMKGIRLADTSDDGGGQAVGWLSAGDWMDYNVDIAAAGKYSVTVRVATIDEGAQLELRSGRTLLTKINIASTKGWDKWTSITSDINLPEGHHKIRLYVTQGPFNINWMKFSSIVVNKTLGNQE